MMPECTKVDAGSEDQGPFEPMTGTIFCGDNLEVMTEFIPDASVDLIYLDPPFNSKRNYNIVYKGSEAQELAFKDYWSWEEASSEYARVLENRSIAAGTRQLLRSLHDLLIDADSDLLAYITMMTPRLCSMHRILRPTGSLYLHCDPTAGHYLKVVLDSIFGADNFLSEIVWKRYGAHGDALRYGAIHDLIFFYGRTKKVPFTKQFIPYTDEYATSRFRHMDPDGRRYQEQNLSSPNPRPNLTYDYTASNGVTYTPHANGWKCDLSRMRELDRQRRLHFPKVSSGRLRLKMYLDECEGVAVQDLWTDISLPASSKERLGYPTQKPLALLERIISASSSEGDLVLDPFCGCGTTVEASEKLGRRWLGIDISRKAVDVIEKRFASADLVPPTVVWHPADLESAAELAARDKLQFERWALRKVRAARRRKKDRGIDGEAMFSEHGGKSWHVIVSVKGGAVNPAMMRDLVGTVARERAAIGVFVTLLEPTAEMRHEAVRAGYLPVSDGEGPIPKIQIVPVARLFGALPAIRCPGLNVTPMPSPNSPEQLSLGIDAKMAKRPKAESAVAASPKSAVAPASAAPARATLAKVAPVPVADRKAAKRR
jgi:site-specific DNA-methyltransferase (adenine-specific)